MAYRSRVFAAAAALASLVGNAGTASAQLYWYTPDFSGRPVTGEEPGITQPLPGATPEELDAGLVWTLRAGLNVAALQCQFAPALRTVSLYNDGIKHHDHEFDEAQATLMGYFTRTLSGAPGTAAKPSKTKPGKAVKTKAPAASKAGQNAFDQFTTRTYNSFSTLHAQLGFCQTAGKIGRIALGAEKGGVHLVARQYLREFRNSLIPAGDMLYAYGGPQPIHLAELDAIGPDCFDRNGDLLFKKKQCRI